jgi:hypothetical protein
MKSVGPNATGGFVVSNFDRLGRMAKTSGGATPRHQFKGDRSKGRHGHERDRGCQSGKKTSYRGRKS